MNRLRDWRWLFAALLTVAATLWAAFILLRPLPGRTVVLATGPPGGAYAVVAERYRASLARHGVDLQLLATAGAIENLARLKDPASHVDAAFVQAGITSAQDSAGLESLGAVFVEPLWFFCRCMPRGLTMQSLTSLRTSIGQEGSGTRALVLRLLALNKLEPSAFDLRSYAPAQAATLLERGEIDGLFTLSAWDSTIVQRLLRDPDIGLVSFTRADAYAAQLPFLERVMLPMGAADLASNRPAADTVLLAPTASLAVRADLHPALQYLLLAAANEAHSGPGVFQRSGEYPAARVIDLPLSDSALRYYKSGPPLLQLYLPFWLAELVQRLLFLALPIAGVLYPLWSGLPRLLRWQAERQLFRIYAELRYLEDRLIHTPGVEQPALMARLEELDRQVAAQSFPRGLSEMRYNLRNHIGLVSRRRGVPHPGS